MRLKSFFLTEMPRGKSDPMWLTLDWAAQQQGTFTIRDLYRVYLANGGRADSIGDNIGSFSTQINHYIAKPGKVKADRRTGKLKDYSVSEKRPILRVQAGARGGAAALLKWGLDKPLRDPSTAKFVDVKDDGPGEAMDKLEALIGPEKLKSAMARWKKLGNMNTIVADIRGTIPPKGQLDAMHIAWDAFGPSTGSDESEPPDAPTPASQDDEEDYGDFSDQGQSFDPDEFEDDEESPVTAAPPARKAPTPPAPSSPEPEESEPEEPDDDVEEPTQQQAGAANFINPPATATPKKSPVSKFFKKR